MNRMATKSEIGLSVKDLRKMLFGLIVVEICFVLIYLAELRFGSPLGTSFNLDKEANIPTWFSSIQLFIIGSIFVLIDRKHEAHHIFRPLFFSFIGIGFIFLSLDEAAVIHEKITVLLRNVEWIPRFKGDQGIWIPFYVATGLGFALMSWRSEIEMWKHFRPIAVALMSGLGIYLLGGVGLEVISYQFLRDGTPLFYGLEVALEEFMEMAGASLVLYGALQLKSRLLSEQPLPVSNSFEPPDNET